MGNQETKGRSVDNDEEGDPSPNPLHPRPCHNEHICTHPIQFAQYLVKPLLRHDNSV